MGYGYYEIDGMKRGYGVRAKCHKRGCPKRIDRGLSYLCYRCTWYFCARHLTYAEGVDDAGHYYPIPQQCFAGEGDQVCERCRAEVLKEGKNDA